LGVVELGHPSLARQCARAAVLHHRSPRDRRVAARARRDLRPGARQSGAAPVKTDRATARALALSLSVVSLLGDMTYEGGWSIVGPYMATLGASAAAVG